MNLAVKPPHAHNRETAEFLSDVREGLRRTQKTLPCKYLYDESGSKLFEQICELHDYYLTRTEAAIFSNHLPEMTTAIGAHALIIEPGAGNCEKARPLLAQLRDPAGYMPMDISPEILLAAKADIQAHLPALAITAAVGDFTSPQVWQTLERPPAEKQVIFFPGSTIGNFDPQQARQLLQSFAEQLRPGDGLLIGADLDKDAVVLERAYHDSEHVTAQFNKNLLVRINRELGGDFDLSRFAHRAFYHPLRQRVEMHLVSLCAQTVTIAGQPFSFRDGETIHTENSHKYPLEDFRQLLANTGFRAVNYWSDPEQYYAVHYAEVL
ncbi:L-histidine N(alpha)-methyltransferase [Microbulbifer sp. SAOS-129_SWC]|uniref:L-histidine N(alpha)-methyltransferase n=1 Tax=Microbulbifer sp. SAOS-129_SWC TaxID=3145235 RepID=UPI0032165527